MVRALALRSGDPRFKTRSDLSLNLIVVVLGSSSLLHWFASGQLGFLKGKYGLEKVSLNQKFFTCLVIRDHSFGLNVFK